MQSIVENITVINRNIPNALRFASMFLVLLTYCRGTMAATVDFTFTGSGANGSVATGAFSIDDAALQPAYYGQISPNSAIFNLSLALSNIPGGTTALSFDSQGSYVYFGLDNDGIARIIPGATCALPDSNFYQLTANTNFYAPPFTPDYHSVLDLVSFSRVQKDDITWSPAVRTVPEPGSLALLGGGLGLMCIIRFKVRRRRAQSSL